jgi:putative oxidoreductase
MTTRTQSLDTRTSAAPLTERALSFLGNQGARALFALPFAVFGLFHFVGADAMAPMVPVPGGIFWVYFTGVALLAGSAGILTGILGRWAALGLAALMALFALTVHLPNLGDPAMGQLSLISLLKDLSLAGGALAFAGLLGQRAK